mmetsp:Transcript_88643/g.180698  ORF Transcript_88643/g.180698 Transcript_88643/m.180698 type:complete len:351 (+) Transcript_88643:83-1135(+)
MALPLPSTNPDDPNFRGKTWDQVEAALDNRDQYIMAMADVDPAYEEERGPTFTDPARPLYTTFPWEEKIEPFAKPPSCTLENWKHTCLKYSLGKHSATLQFDKGTMNNTLDPAMLDALQDAICDLQTRSSVRVVILKSSGKLFSNGFDPKYLISETMLTEEDITKVQLQFGKILYFWQRLPQLTIALVQGSTMGAAVGLVCACDMVISVKGAFYAMSETKLGAVATTSIPYITRRIRFIRNVYQLVLAGASLSADTAKEYGIVSEVVDSEADLETKCKSICDLMTLCAPGAVAATKEVVMNTVGVPVSSFLLNYVASVARDVRQGPEARSGIQSIQDKKKPVWASAAIVP